MPRRIQRKRTAGWRKGDAVIVDRTSRFGNPFRIASAMDAFGYDEAEARKAVVAVFPGWLAGSREEWTSAEADRKRERILADLPLLRGRDLACPCPEGEACHADELIRWANLPEPELAERIATARARVDRHRTWRGEEPMYAAAATPTPGGAA
jgi:hypothetical protein